MHRAQHHTALHDRSEKSRGLCRRESTRLCRSDQARVGRLKVRAAQERYNRGMTTSSKLITADELLKMGDIGRCELVYGELVMMSPAGAEHGAVAGRIFRLIANFVEQHHLGMTFAAETGFRLAADPDTVRAPDASFVRRQRVKGRLTKKFFEGAPDLAVEVVSPDDRKREVADKKNAWLAHGAISVW